MQYPKTITVGLIVVTTVFALSGCLFTDEGGTGKDATELETIAVKINNHSVVEVYYVAFLPEGGDPETAPEEDWTVYPFGDDYVGPDSVGSFSVAKPDGSYCSIFVGRNTFELSPVDKGWRWDQPYGGEELIFSLYSDEPPYSCMRMDEGPCFARNEIDLSP